MASVLVGMLRTDFDNRPSYYPVLGLGSEKPHQCCGDIVIFQEIPTSGVGWPGIDPSLPFTIQLTEWKGSYVCETVYAYDMTKGEWLEIGFGRESSETSNNRGIS